MKKTVMERIEAEVGTVTGWDGKLCLWANGRPRDIRDVLPKGMTLAEAVDALDEFDAEASKQRKAALKKAKQEEEDKE